MSMRAPSMKVARAATNARTASACSPSSSRWDSHEGATRVPMRPSPSPITPRFDMAATYSFRRGAMQHLRK